MVRISCPVYYAPAEMMSIPFHLPQVSYRAHRDARVDDPGVYPRDTICNARFPVLDARTIQSVPISSSPVPLSSRVFVCRELMAIDAMRPT